MSGSAQPSELAHAAFRGAVGAMAMTGIRRFAHQMELIGETPPDAILRRKGHRALALVPRSKRRAFIEAAHWGYGAGGGAMFGALPEDVRRRAWAGPAFGIVLWLGFEFGIAPLLGLPQAKERRLIERVVLASDHVLYGLVLTEGRPRPQESP